MMIQNHVKFKLSIYMNMKNFQKDFDYFDNSFVTYLRPQIGYKCLINHFSPSNVDIIDSFFICYS